MKQALSFPLELLGFLDDRCQCSLGLPTRLQKRGEVARVADPGHLQFHRPHPRGPRTIPVAVALSLAPRAALVRRRSYVLSDLHLHECLGE
jgi:hypothetical protein